MSSMAAWITFLLSAFLIIMSPGPDFMYVMTQGTGQGRWAGVLSALGISTGLLIHTSLAAAGLTTLILALPAAFEVTKIAGAIYLIYLAVKLFRSKGALVPPDAPSQIGSSRLSILRQGALTNLLNPKAMLTFLAFIPQFITRDGSAPIQVMVLGGTMALLGAGWFSLIGYFAGMVGEWLAHSQAARWINRITGCVLLGLGLRLAFLAH